MTGDLFNETILALKRRRPFVPFTVAMVNGDRVEIDFPEALAIREGFALFAGPGSVPHVFDHEGVNQIIGDLAGRPTAE